MIFTKHHTYAVAAWNRATVWAIFTLWLLTALLK
jgi:hypothetical protein